MTKTEMIARSGGLSPEQMKRKVRRFEPCAMIYHSGEVYEIKYNELINKALDHLEEIEEVGAQLGQNDLSGLSKNCFHCNYNSENVFSAIVNGKNPGVNCSYQSQKDVAIADEFRHPKNWYSFYATVQPCVVDDAMVSYLSENGKLEGYKEDKVFNYYPISKFESGEITPDQVPTKKLTLVDRLKEHFPF